jgi:hypothetical protein
MKTMTKQFIPALLVLSAPLTAAAHSLWILPSQFDIAANEHWISADAAISVTPFHYDGLPMPLEGLAITAPDGSTVTPTNPEVRQRRSLFDVELLQDGVYRLALHDHALFAMYKVDGQVKKWHGTSQAFQTLLPANALDVKVSETDTRLESFVVRNRAGAMAPPPLGVGLEIVPQAPLDSFKRGGATSFVVLLDGKPAADIEVAIVTDNENGAGKAAPVKVSTATDGKFSIHWATSGRYLLTAQRNDAHVTLKPASQRRLVYGLTISVLQ